MIRLIVSLVGAGMLLPAQSTTFQYALHGCPLAHCDGNMSDLVRLPAPASPTTVLLSHDTDSAGKGIGLGCSSNGVFAACSFKDPSGNNLIFYSADGKRMWASGSLLNVNAWASAPMISSEGDVIATDDVQLVRLTAKGKLVWSAPVPGGIPISPVMTNSGAVVLATYGGPVSAFSGADGHPIGALLLHDADSGSSYYDTLNTPCVRGNRAYISTRLSIDPNGTGALIAVDVDPSNAAEPLRIAWKFPFGAPSGASPLCLGNTIVFDGGSAHPGEPFSPQIFAVRDEGAGPSLVWNETVPSALPANIAADPRGGVWALFTGVSYLARLDPNTGAVIERLNVTALVDDPTPNYPYSAISLAGTAANPVMLLGTTSLAGDSAYVIAIDLATRTLLWKVNIAPSQGSDSAPSQFPIVLDKKGNPVVVFSGRSSGAYFVGEPK